MNKENFLKLTLAVYRVTELFPEGEFLKSEIREAANKILIAFLSDQNNNDSQILKELIGYFDSAEAKNWVDPRNFLVLRREYGKLTSQKEPAGKEVKKQFCERQTKILEYLQNNGKTPIRSLHQLFPAVNRRTLIRDLDRLLQAGLAERKGNGRGVYYTDRA